jgi:hypothetical protein
MKLDECFTCNTSINNVKPENYIYNTYNQPQHTSHNHKQRRHADYNSFFANLNTSNFKNSSRTYDPCSSLPPPPPSLLSDQPTSTTTTTHSTAKNFFNQQQLQPTLYSYTPTKQNTSSAASQFLYNHQPVDHEQQRHVYYQVSEASPENDTDDNEQLLIKINPLATGVPSSHTNSSASSNGQFAEQNQHPSSSHGISDEETRRLSGLVAKTRALFESKTTNTGQNQNQQKSTNRSSINKSISVNNLNNNNKANNNNANFPNNAKTTSSSSSFANRSVVELLPHQQQIAQNELTNFSQILSNPQHQMNTTVNPILSHSNSFHGDSLSANQQRYKSSEMSVSNGVESKRHLWSRSENSEDSATTELNIPKSVKEARMCFENLAMGKNNSNTMSMSMNRNMINGSAGLGSGPNGSYSRLAKSQILQNGSTAAAAQRSTSNGGVCFISYIMYSLFAA